MANGSVVPHGGTRTLAGDGIKTPSPHPVDDPFRADDLPMDWAEGPHAMPMSAATASHAERDERMAASNPDRSPARWLWLAPLLLALGCLWQGLPGSARREVAALAEPSTAVAGTMANHRAEMRSVSTPRLLTRRIDEIRPGMRVLAEHPDARQNAKPDVDIHPPYWRLVSLKMPHPEGGVLEVDTLRPAAWLRDYDAGVGGVVPLAVAELGEAGLALVVDIQPCPAIQQGPGRIVTSTFRHAADSVLELHLASHEQIGTTSNHPFWSEDRHDFVAAKDLVRGERLRNADGHFTTVASLAARGGRRTVYNLEVDAEHVYHVGAGGVLVHNTCVYRSVVDGIPEYIGITGNFTRRAGEHARLQERAIRMIPGMEDLTYRQARAVEHLLIEKFGRVGSDAGGVLSNVNRGIDPRKLGKYTEELSFARNLLNSLGF